MRESTLDYSDPIPCQLHDGCKSTVCIQATSLEAPRLQVKRCPDTPLVISTHYQVFGRVKSQSTIKFQRQRFGYAFGYVEIKNVPKDTFLLLLWRRVGFPSWLQTLYLSQLLDSILAFYPHFYPHALPVTGLYIPKPDAAIAVLQGLMVRFTTPRRTNPTPLKLPPASTHHTPTRQVFARVLPAGYTH